MDTQTTDIDCESFSQQNDAFCERCSRLDLDLLFSGSAPSLRDFKYDGKDLLDIGVLSAQDETSSCPACRLWSICRNGRDDKPFFLRQRREINFESPRADPFNSPFAQIYIVRNGPDVVPPASSHLNFEYLKFIPPQKTDGICHIMRRPDMVDFGLIRSWLDQCRAKHTQCAEDVSIGDGTPPIHVIDCSTGELHRATSHDGYVALSYVWGNDESQAGLSASQMLSDYPLLVRDAMTVTKSVGLRYLWIDRLCVSELDPILRMEQITNMDLVYERAEMTIISLGESLKEGLPGVSEVARRRQASLQTSSGTIRSAMRSPLVQIKASKWWTRAWTFQEGLLSRRRLIFTKDQAYFECQGMHKSEVRVHNRERRFLRPNQFDGGLEMPAIPFRSFHSASNLTNLLSDYREREMTYATDALAAFLGILTRHTRNSTSCYHYFGLPFHIQQENLDADLQDLNAIIVKSFAYSLDWWALKPVRRKEFPSWNWTGWVGKGRGRQPFEPWNKVPAWDCKVTEIWIESPDETLQTLRQFMEAGGLQLPISSLAPYIWLEAPTVRIELFHKKGTATIEILLLWTAIELGALYYRDHFSSFNMPSEEHQRQYTDWEAVLLGCQNNGPATILIIAERNAVKERISCVQIRHPPLADPLVPKQSSSQSDPQNATWEEIKWTHRKTRLG